MIGFWATFRDAHFRSSERMLCYGAGVDRFWKPVKHPGRAIEVRGGFLIYTRMNSENALSLPATNSVRTKSSLPSARAGWANCTGRAIRGSTAP